MDNTFGFPKKPTVATNLSQYLYAEDLTAGDVGQIVNIIGNTSGAVGLAKAHNKFTGTQLQGNSLTNSNGFTRTVALDSTRVLQVYADASETNLWCRVLTRNTSTWAVTQGGGTIISTGGWSSSYPYFKLCKINTDKVAIVFSNAIDSGYHNVIVITISGTTIQTVGTPVRVSTTASSYFEIQSHVADKFIVAYYSSNAIQVRVGTVSGTTITLQTGTACTSIFGTNYGLSSAPLSMVIRDSSHFSLLLTNTSEVFHGAIDGSNLITVSTPKMTLPQYAEAGVEEIVMLSATVGVLYHAMQATGGLRFTPFTYSGGQIVCGTARTISPSGGYYPKTVRITRLDVNRFVVILINGNYDCSLTVGQISSNSITFGLESVFASLTSYLTSNISVICPTTTKAIVCWSEYYSNIYSSYRACSISGTTVSSWGSTATGGSLPQSYNSDTNSRGMTIAKVRQDYFMSIFRDNGGYTRLELINSADAGLTITISGSSTALDPTASRTGGDWMELVYLADNKLVATYGPGGKYLQIVNVSGTTISAGTYYLIPDGTIYAYTSNCGRPMRRISATQFLIAWSAYNPMVSKVAIFNVDGSDNITIGSTYACDSPYSIDNQTFYQATAFDFLFGSTTQGIFMNQRGVLALMTLDGSNVPSWSQTAYAITYPYYNSTMLLCKLNDNVLIVFLGNQRYYTEYVTLLMAGETHSLVEFKRVYNIMNSASDIVPYNNGGHETMGILTTGINNFIFIGMQSGVTSDIVMVEFQLDSGGKYQFYHNNIVFSANVIKLPRVLSIQMLDNQFAMINYQNSSDYYIYNVVVRFLPYIEFQIQDGANGIGIIQKTGPKGMIGKIALSKTNSTIHTGLQTGKKYYYDPTTLALSTSKPAGVLAWVAGIATSPTTISVQGGVEGLSKSRQALRPDTGTTLYYFTYVNGVLSLIETS